MIGPHYPEELASAGWHSNNYPPVCTRQAERAARQAGPSRHTGYAQADQPKGKEASAVPEVFAELTRGSTASRLAVTPPGPPAQKPRHVLAEADGHSTRNYQTS